MSLKRRRVISKPSRTERSRPCTRLLKQLALGERLRLFLGLLFGLSLFLALPLHAQEQTGEAQARLEGTVTDETGAPLAGVNVYVPSLDQGTATEPDGSYRIDGLPAQTLSVRFSYVGYGTRTREVALEPGETHQLDVALAETALEGEEIVVTGTPVAQEQLRSTQDVDVVSPEQLEAQRTAALGDVIEESVPGAASVKTGTQAGKPVLRGLTGSRIRLLKDGIAQEYYQFGVRHFPNTSLAEAERVEVVRGPASILYGSDALGGAINVLPKSLPEEGLGGTLGGQYFANNDERVATLNLRGGTGELGARAGLERRVAGNFTTPEAPTFFETGKGGTYGDPKYTGEIPHTNFNQWAGYGQVGIDGAFGSLQLFGDYWKNEHNFLLPTGGPRGDEENPPVGLGQSLEHVDVTLKGNLPAGDFVLEPRLSYQRAIRRSAGAGNTLETVDAVGDAFDWPIDLLKDVYTARLEALHPTIGAMTGTIGAEAVYQDGRSEGPVPLEPSATFFNIGVFAFEEFDLDPMTLSIGARLDHRTQEADPPQETVEALGLSAEDLENSYTTFSGSVGANYRFAEDWAFVANFGSGFRAPSIFELYANGEHGGVAALQQGNPDLRPERAYSADLGIRARTDRVTGELTSYYNYIADYIYLRNTGENAGEGGPPIYTSGQTNASIAGIEAMLRAQVQPWLEIGGETALLTSEGEDLEGNAQGDRVLPLIPADRMSGFVRVEPDRVGLLQSPFAEAKVRHAFAKDAAGRYEPFSQFDGEFGPPFGTASTRAYTVVDLTAGSAVAFQGVTLRLNVGVKNLSDEVYRNFLDTYKGYALSPGRNLFVKLTVPFGEQ